VIPALRYLSDLELGELRRRLHRELHGASVGADFALSVFCVMVGDEFSRRGNPSLCGGCPACLTTVRAGVEAARLLAGVPA
jgi:hypothetical protein